MESLKEDPWIILAAHVRPVSGWPIIRDVVRVENGVDRGKLFEKEKQEEEEEERQLAGVGSCGCIIDTCNRSSHSSSVFEIFLNYIYV